MRFAYSFILGLAAISGLAASDVRSAQTPEFLDASQAFTLEASSDANGIHLTWQIADDHYAYRKRLAVRSITPGVELGQMVAPRGDIKQDRWFGEVETYRESLPITVPVLRGEGQAVLAATIQGCADAGLCYPPHTLELTLAVAPTAGAAAIVEMAQGDDISPRIGASSPSRLERLAHQLGVPAPRGPVESSRQVLAAAAGSSTGAASDAGEDDPARQARMRSLAAALGLKAPGEGETATLDGSPEQRSEQSAQQSQDGQALNALGQLGKSLGLGGADEYLEPDQAFVLEARVTRDGSIEANWAIHEGYYLYRSKFEFAVTGGDGAALGEVSMAPGMVKEDEYFGTVEVHYQQALATVPVHRALGNGQRLALRVTYQGCADAGLCYPPIDKDFALSLPADFAPSTGGAALVKVAATTPGASASAAAPAAAANGASRADAVVPVRPMVSEQDRLTGVLASGNVWLSVAAFFVGGLLLAFTPCVLPMIPILSGIIVGQGEDLSRRRAFMLSFVYVQGMALTYTAVGFVAALAGANIQALFQDPVVLTTFAAVFIALAMSMFGFYELQVPAAIQARLAALSNRQRSGSYLGAGVMGALSAIIVGPCVAPPLVGALSFITEQGDPALGALALYALALGMGAPLLLVGASAGQLLPRVGAWMETVKAVFGVVLLAVAVYFLRTVLPDWVYMLAWAALFIITAIYMGAFDHMAAGVSGWRRLWKGTGIVMMVYGVLLMVGAAGGGTDPLLPLKGVAGVASAPREAHLNFRPVKGLAGLKAALAEARQLNRPVMLDYYADWCVSCIEFEKYTFTDAGVQAALNDVILLRTDVTANDAADKALMAQFKLYGPPVIQFFMPDGNEERNYRVVGYMDAPAFRTHLNKLFRG